jgi:hypothetical protein
MVDKTENFQKTHTLQPRDDVTQELNVLWWLSTQLINETHIRILIILHRHVHPGNATVCNGFRM